MAPRDAFCSFKRSFRSVKTVVNLSKQEWFWFTRRVVMTLNCWSIFSILRYMYVEFHLVLVHTSCIHVSRYSGRFNWFWTSTSFSDDFTLVKMWEYGFASVLKCFALLISAYRGLHSQVEWMGKYGKWYHWVSLIVKNHVTGITETTQITSIPFCGDTPKLWIIISRVSSTGVKGLRLSSGTDFMYQISVMKWALTCTQQYCLVWRDVQMSD